MKDYHLLSVMQSIQNMSEPQRYMITKTLSDLGDIDLQEVETMKHVVKSAEKGMRKVCSVLRAATTLLEANLDSEVARQAVTEEISSLLEVAYDTARSEITFLNPKVYQFIHGPDKPKEKEQPEIA